MMSNEATHAANKAMELYQSKRPEALIEYMHQWRDGEVRVSAAYLLAVIAHYGTLTDNSIRPDFTMGKLELKFNMHRAFWDKADVNLTFTEFRVVKAFVDQPNVFISYRAVYDVVRHVGFCAGIGTDGYRTNVRSVIKRIRNKFLALDPDWNHIENYPSFGYRWLKTDIVVLPRAGSAPEIAVIAK